MIDGLVGGVSSTTLVSLDAGERDGRRLVRTVFTYSSSVESSMYLSFSTPEIKGSDWTMQTQEVRIRQDGVSKRQHKC